MWTLINVVLVVTSLGIVLGQSPAAETSPIVGPDGPVDTYPFDLYGDDPLNYPTDPTPSDTQSSEPASLLNQSSVVTSSGTTPQTTQKVHNGTTDKLDPDVLPPSQFFKFLAGNKNRETTVNPSTEDKHVDSDTIGQDDKFNPDNMPPGEFMEFLVAKDKETNVETVETTNINQNPFDPDILPPEKFMEWLSGNEPVNKFIEVKVNDPFNLDILPPEKFMEWLRGNEPVAKFIEVKKQTIHEPKEMGLNRQMIIIIATVTGTVSLCVVVLLALVCRRRAVNKKEAKIKAESPIHDQPKQDVYVLRKQDPNMFWGIPANNDIWKDLQTLPESASVVIPESQKK